MQKELGAEVDMEKLKATLRKSIEEQFAE